MMLHDHMSVALFVLWMKTYGYVVYRSIRDVYRVTPYLRLVLIRLRSITADIALHEAL